MSIKAIETVYNGYRFRSRLEARWAVFFDALGIKYQYEAEGFDLDGVWYLPDFKLINPGCFVEIKGSPENEGQWITKAKRLVELGNTTVFVFIGDVWPSECEIDILTMRECSCPDCSKGKHAELAFVYCERFDVISAIETWLLRRNGTITLNHAEAALKIWGAFEAARQARFEHGESGED